MEAPKPEYLSLAEHGLDVPQLLLSCGALRGTVSPLPGTGPWLHIKHETGGPVRRSHQLFGLLLTPTGRFGDALRELEARWRGSAVTPETITLDELLRYNDDVAQLLGGKTACESDHDKLEEGLYPINCELASLRKITGESWPRELDELLDWSEASKIDRIFGHLSRWEMLLLGANSA